jgi:hypothetical protein
MLKATKSFKIGESVVGGIICVIIKGNDLTLEFRDYYSKRTVLKMETSIDARNVRRKLSNFLEENGTPYYSEKVLKWIESKVELNREAYGMW